jgi:hypothetical protein
VNRTGQGVDDSVLCNLFGAAVNSPTSPSCTAHGLLDEISIFIGCRSVESPHASTDQILAATALLLAWTAIVAAPFLALASLTLFTIRLHLSIAFLFALAGLAAGARRGLGLNARQYYVFNLPWRLLHRHLYLWVVSAAVFPIASSASFGVATLLLSPPIHRAARIAAFTCLRLLFVASSLAASAVSVPARAASDFLFSPLAHSALAAVCAARFFLRGFMHLLSASAQLLHASSSNSERPVPAICPSPARRRPPTPTEPRVGQPSRLLPGPMGFHALHH